MMNAKSKIKVFQTKGIIEINTTFVKMMQDPLSDEYALLQKTRMENPTFTVRRRQIKTNPKKDTYKGLTYGYMRDYIILHTTPEKEAEAVAEFDEMVLISKCHGKTLRYPTIKKWFLEKYPEVAKFGAVDAAEEAAGEAQEEETKSENVIPKPEVQSELKIA